ncbi:hypothetical protein JCM8097_001282 [Rhodosporidiobolus ruineniae]
MALKDKLPSRRQTIAIGKGTLAYCLAFVFIFLHGFSRLSDYPITLTGTILITIAGQPGLSVGACWDQAIYGALGVGVGGACFVLLAKIGSRVGQGFVLAAFVYLLALVKAQSMKYFAFALLAIILAFSGIYTSILSGGFVPEYLEAYLEAYLWGFAIVLVVNLLVFPHSSEKELRELLVLSIEHISTFSHLIAKTYSLEITEDEKKVRDGLAASIRADMGLLNQKLATTSVEVNYSRWSMADYSLAIAKVRAIQRGLITSFSSLVAMEKYDPQALDLLKRELQETAVTRAFSKLRRSADLSFADLVNELAVGKATYHSPAPGEHSWADFHEGEEDVDVESGQGRPRGVSLSRQKSDARQARLVAMRERLRNEVATAGSTPVVSRRPSVSGVPDVVAPASPDLAKEAAEALAAKAARASRRGEVKDKVAFLRSTWDSFKSSQLEAIQKMLVENVPDDNLRLYQPGPSMHDLYLNPPARFDPRAAAETAAAAASTTATAPSNASATVKRSATKTTAGSIEEKNDNSPPSSESGATDVTDVVCATAVMRFFAFIAGMGSVVDELADLYAHIVRKPGEPQRKKQIRFHVFERKSPKPAATAANGCKEGKKDAPRISLREAIARLAKVDFAPKKLSIWQRIAGLERLLRSDTSIYALKTAAAVSVYAVFLLAPSLSTFFVNYGLTSGIITIVVALAPTLGQTAITFVLQILGTGIGSILGMIICYIFRNVGGYAYNPYGMVVFAGLIAVPASAIIYCRPMFFAGALLCLNGAGVIIVTEYTYGGDLPGWTRPGFDSPGLRCAKQLVAMCIALAIAFIFQAFILRTPARQTLRRNLANITWSLNAYTVLLGFSSEAVMPMGDSTDCPPPDREALEVVKQELIAREQVIQNELLGLMPLMKFSMAEPTWGQPFKAATITRVIRAHQLILDRLRESRTAIGDEGFSPAIRKHFSDILVPYRKQGRRVIRALFYLTATSLSTKQPLPSELPSMVATARHIQHDAMVLSGRLAKTEAGREILQSQVFLRYWFYLVAYSSIAYLLEGLEPELRELFGTVEDSPFVADSKAEVAF